MYFDFLRQRLLTFDIIGTIKYDSETVNKVATQLCMEKLQTRKKD